MCCAACVGVDREAVEALAGEEQAEEMSVW